MYPRLINKNFRNIDVGSLELFLSSFQNMAVLAKFTQLPADLQKIKNKS